MKKREAQADAKRLSVLARMLKTKFPHKIKRVLDTDSTVDTKKLRDEARRNDIDDERAYVMLSKLAKTWGRDDVPLSDLTWFEPNGLPPNLFLDRLLGSGTYGEVWLATEVTTNRQYAAKIFTGEREEAEQDIDDEGVILQWVNAVTRTGTENPNVLGYVGAWKNWIPPGNRDNFPRNSSLRTRAQNRPLPLLVSEYINGSELGAVFQLNERNDWRPWFDINWFAEQLFNGVAFMHQKGIAHRDLKMDNIMVHAPYYDSDGNYHHGKIVIIDLGLSCVIDDVSRETRLFEKACSQQQQTQGGAWVYLSPEIANFYQLNRKAANLMIFQPDLSIQYSNDVWAASLCLLGVILGDYAVKYLAPTILYFDYGDDAVDHFLATLKALHGSTGTEQLVAGKRDMDDATKIIAERHMQKARDVSDAETQRWQSALDILAMVSDLFTSIEKRKSATDVLERIREFNETRASASPPQVWRNGDALEVSDITPYDVVI